MSSAEYDHDGAQRMRERFLSVFSPPEEWEEDSNGVEYPHAENVSDSFPDDYKRQYEVAGYWVSDEARVGVWWLRDGERFQVYYDRGDDSEWGTPGDAEAVAAEIRDKMTD